jgi:glycyl-tRNA synthetase beta chain
MADFLLEIGLEEVPARMIAGAEAELGHRVNELLARERLLDTKTRLTTYSTPRRLAVLVEDLLGRQADIEEQLTGPSWKVAFKDGAPTAAAEAFAKKAGVPVEELKKMVVPHREAAPFGHLTGIQEAINKQGPVEGFENITPEKAGIGKETLALLEKIINAKGEYLGATVKREGRAASELLAAELPKEILGLYWAKNMYWRAGKPERFVRPVRWVVALLDSSIVPLEIAGISAGNTSRGHRVLHGEAPVVIDLAKNYSEKLRKAFVVVDVAERRLAIRKALDAATRTVAGARWREDEPLIETVVHLTEWPTVVLGDFEPEYLALPEEVLVTVMRDHQKYFAVECADGKLAPHFLAVLNTQVDAEGEAIIRHGNARVLTARFKDARFFWNFDQKTPLVDRVESLKHVTFQKELGSYYDKTLRVKLLVDEFAGELQKQDYRLDRDAVLAAAHLSKTDLTSELVKEFTELQGIIGGLYARTQGHNERVSLAIYSQYKPSSSEDEIPPSIEGQLLSIADKADSIAGMFGIGLQPTGSKDPFALRRAANGIVKILAEAGLPLRIELIATLASDRYRPDLFPAWKQTHKNLVTDIRFLFVDRLNFYLKDVRGFAYDVVAAVLAAGSDDVRDAIARAEALTAARESDDFAAISAAFKRIKNILRQAEEKHLEIGSPTDVTLAAEAQQLLDASSALVPEVSTLRQRRAYGEALAAIATLRPAVDAFFDKVLVLDPDPVIRGAHLGLIDEVLRGFSGIADFSEIVTP